MDWVFWVIFVVSFGIGWVLWKFFVGCLQVLRSITENIEESALYSNWASLAVINVLQGFFGALVLMPFTLFVAFGMTPLDIAVLLQMIFIECDIDGFWSHIVGTSGNCGPKVLEAATDGFLGWKGLTGMFGWTP